MEYALAFFEFYRKEIMSAMEKIDINDLKKIAYALEKCRLRKGHVYIFGNGGSAGIAAHFAHNLNWDVSSKLAPGAKFAAVALNELSCHISGVANDTHYDQVFVAQLHNYLKKRDVVIGISASGNSENVIEAIKFSRSMGCETITLTGNKGGAMLQHGTINLVVDSTDQQATEDVQQVICHSLVRILHYHVNQTHTKNGGVFNDIANLRDKEVFLSRRKMED